MGKHKKHKKGFTMIELLAVIVILALILVIAVPSITKIIADAKYKSFRISVINAFNAAKLAVSSRQETGGLLANLDMANNKFTGGSWSSVNDKIYILYATDGTYEARNINETNKDEDFDVKGLTADDSYKTLANKINSFPACIGADVTIPCIVTNDDNTKGYIRGPLTGVNNYVTYSGKKWRVIKVNSDGTVVMIADVHATINTFYPTGAQFNNYAISPLRTYLNTTFYNTLVNKQYIMEATWNTANQSGGGDPTTVKNYVGMLTYFDYATGTASSATTYLKYGTNSWLGTGSTSAVYNIWTVYSDGTLTYISGNNFRAVRPVIVLNSGISITGGDGTTATPYTIE
jgi:prepilin-type N-terminal cleavage/methylation domain-containing protein